MNIDHLSEFIELAETCNYMEAADVLFISQSSLSRHIKSLEEELGVPLFDRTTRRVKLTSFGQTLLPYAREIRGNQEKCYYQLGLEKAKGDNTIRLGSFYMFVPYDIPGVITSYREKYPQYTVTVFGEHSANLHVALKKNNIDFAFGLRPSFYDPSIKSVELFPDRLAVGVSGQHPWAGRTAVNITELKGVPMILFPRENILGSDPIRLCNNAGFEPNVFLYSRQISDILTLVETGRYMTILQKQCQTYTKDRYDVKFVDLTPEIPYSFYLTYSKDLPMTPARRAFRDFVKSVYL